MTTPNWQYAALEATAESQFGAILAAALGKDIPAPRFTSSATVTSDGFIMADFEGTDGRKHMGAFVGSADDLARNLRGLAKHLSLTEAERDDLFNSVRAWIAADYSDGKALAALRGRVN